MNIDRLQNMNTIHPHQKDQVRKLAYLHVIAYQHREKQPHLQARLLDEAPRSCLQYDGHLILSWSVDRSCDNQ